VDLARSSIGESSDDDACVDLRRRRAPAIVDEAARDDIERLDLTHHLVALARRLHGAISDESCA
jgi:hypothetical protein